jgi:poly(3-hydroxybutyrate) depolymerase
MRLSLRRRTAVRAAAALAAVGLSLAGSGVGNAAASGDPGLSPLNISDSYVTGISSGGFMAAQLQVAYSGEFSGAGIFAAGPYDCGQGRILTTLASCGPDILPGGPGPLEDQARAWAAQGAIDDTANLVNKPVYVYHGILDPLVSIPAANDGVEFWQDMGANVTYHNWDWAGHGWPSPLGILPCGLTTPPFGINCWDDPEGEMLNTWFNGAVNPANNGTPAGSLTTFDQTRYVPGGNANAIGLSDYGYVYTPTACANGTSCHLVVALHGCASDHAFLGDYFAKNTYLNQYADTNNLVVLYPQTAPTAIPIDPLGCWDWYGYDGSNFAQKSGPQMAAVMGMVNAIKA